MDFLTEPPFGTDAHAVADDQHPQHQVGIDRGPADSAVERPQLCTDALQINKPVDAAKQMIPWHIIIEAEIIEQLRRRDLHAVAVGSYLSKLCETLAASMISDSRAISLKVVAGEGTSTSSDAVSIGLIVTELVINAIKHAFPERPRSGQQVIVGYEAEGKNWKLSIPDNGDGMPYPQGGSGKTGLGTSLIKALAQQLEAQVDVVSGPKGTTVSITHATFVSRLPTAA